jgi:hypothetical protein
MSHRGALTSKINGVPLLSVLRHSLQRGSRTVRQLYAMGPVLRKLLRVSEGKYQRSQILRSSSSLLPETCIFAISAAGVDLGDPKGLVF